MKFLIEAAETILIGDFVILPVPNILFPREIHLMGKVLDVSFDAYPEVVELKVKLLAHIDGVQDDNFLVGIRRERKVGVIRGQGIEQ